MSSTPVAVAAAMAVLATLLSVPARAEDAASTTEPHTRQLWNDAFLKQRQAAAAATVAPAPAATIAAPARKPVKAKKPAARATASSGEAFLGVTLWRLRPATARDRDGGLVLFRSETEELVAERVEAGTVFAPGDKVRIGIESGRSGYLYLLDRERYADGTTSDSYLISPTLRIRKGENAVGAGRLVEVPDSADQPPFFVMKRSRPDQVGEEVIVLVSETPLTEVEIGEQAAKVPPETLARWERSSAKQTAALGAEATAGKPYTRAERESGQLHTRLLTHEEPLPQTLYRLVPKPGQPLMVNVPLAIPKR
jgi:hypothetical protein